MSESSNEETPQALKQLSVVAVPTEVFKQIVDRLALQPYKDVGPLLNLLVTYKPQIARVE